MLNAIGGVGWYLDGKLETAVLLPFHKCLLNKKKLDLIGSVSCIYILGHFYNKNSTLQILSLPLPLLPCVRLACPHPCLCRGDVGALSSGGQAAQLRDAHQFLVHPGVLRAAAGAAEERGTLGWVLRMTRVGRFAYLLKRNAETIRLHS
jgi:hypothetical protein